MTSDQDDDDSRGEPSAAKAPWDQPDRLVTSQDLFGDLVDEAPAEAPAAAPQETVRAPIRVRLSEPIADEKGMRLREAPSPPSPEQIALVLDAIDDGTSRPAGEAAPSEALQPRPPGGRGLLAASGLGARGRGPPRADRPGRAAPASLRRLRGRRSTAKRRRCWVGSAQLRASQASPGSSKRASRRRAAPRRLRSIRRALRQLPRKRRTSGSRLLRRRQASKPSPRASTSRPWPRKPSTR